MDDHIAPKTSKSKPTDAESGTLYRKRDSKDVSKLMLLEQEDCLCVPGRVLYHCDKYSREAMQGRNNHFWVRLSEGSVHIA